MNAALSLDQSNKFSCQTRIDRYRYEQSHFREYIDREIKYHKIRILENLVEQMPDEQHFAIRFRTFREDSYDYFIVRTTLDITKVQYQNIRMVRFEEFSHDGIGGFTYQPFQSEKKEQWRCVYCGHMQNYEIIKIIYGQKIIEVNRKCQDCGGPKLS